MSQAASTLFLTSIMGGEEYVGPRPGPPTAPFLNILLIIHGSRKHADFDSEYDRRVEIDMRLHLPRSGMSGPEIEQFGRDFVFYHYTSLKHSQKWHCEFCGEFTVSKCETISLIGAGQTSLRVCLKAK